MSIQGKWDKSEITINESKQVTVTIDSRPNGNGTVLCENPDVILVSFPDDNIYIGTLINEKQIQWSGLGELGINNVWNR